MLKVLVLNDSALSRYVIRDILTVGGHTTTQAASALEALSQLSSGNFDLVVAELRVSWPELLEFFEQALKKSSAPFFLIINSTEIVMGREALAAGFSEILCKPIVPANFLQLIEKHCSNGSALMQSRKVTLSLSMEHLEHAIRSSSRQGLRLEDFLEHVLASHLQEAKTKSEVMAVR